MRYYLDTEFAEWASISPGGYRQQGIELISIALVGEDGSEFYAVNDHFQEHLCNDWVQKHVLPQLPPRLGDTVGPPVGSPWMSPADIERGIKKFLGIKNGVAPNPEIWAYYADYDWVLFCQLFGTMMDMPEGMPHLCMDLKQYAIHLGVKRQLKELVPMPKGEHDALEDARWNKRAHDHLLLIDGKRRGYV